MSNSVSVRVVVFPLLPCLWLYPLPGKGTSALFIAEDPLFELSAEMEKQLPVVPLETTLALHWLGIEGKQPACKENPPSLGTSETFLSCLLTLKHMTYSFHTHLFSFLFNFGLICRNLTPRISNVRCLVVSMCANQCAGIVLCDSMRVLHRAAASSVEVESEYWCWRCEGGTPAQTHSLS